MTLARWLLVAALAISIATSGVCGYAAWKISEGQARVAALTPISLEKGATVDFPFRVDVDGLYDVSLEVSRNLPLDEMKAQLSLGGAATDTEPLLRWRVQDHRARLIAGDIPSEFDRIGSFGPTVSKSLGRVYCYAGSEYLLRGEVTRSLPGLSIAEPRLRVALDLRAQKAAATTAFELYALAGALASCSVLQMSALWALSRLT
jgi:hypothetical protein